MRIINKKYLLILLFIGIIITGVIIFRPKENIQLDNVILKQEVNNKTFAMYKEESENNYVKVEDNKFLDMYVLNLTESKCIDNNGNEIRDALSYENSEVVLTTNKSSYCYLYFDKSAGLKIIENKPNNLNENQAGMYRYQGSKDEVNNNYICFGTTDTSQCLNNKEQHMYRIIGITNEGLLKVIKNTSIGNYSYNSDTSVNVKWPESDLYKGLNNVNEGIFLGSTYIPKNFEEYIAEKEWYYGSYISSAILPKSIEEIYLEEIGQMEVNWYEKVDNSEKDKDEISCSLTSYGDHINQEVCYKRLSGKFSKLQAKIGLLNATDINYATIKNGKVCDYMKNDTNIAQPECEKSWLNYSNISQEYLIMTGGYSYVADFYGGWGTLKPSGSPAYFVVSELAVRPVFYLKSDINLNGSGIINDPFIIKE